MNESYKSILDQIMTSIKPYSLKDITHTSYKIIVR
jgi:hypothetical protein